MERGPAVVGIAPAAPPRKSSLGFLIDGFGSAIAGAAALPLVGIAASIVGQLAGDTLAVHACFALALAAGLWFGALVRPGRFAWCRSAGLGAIALFALATVPWLTERVAAGNFPARAVIPIIVLSSSGLALGSSIGLTLATTPSRSLFLVMGGVFVVGIELGVSRNFGREGALLLVGFLGFLPSVLALRDRRAAREGIEASADRRAPLQRVYDLSFDLGAGATLGVFFESAALLLRDVYGAAAENRLFALAATAVATALALVVGPRLRVARGRALLFAAIAASIAVFALPEAIARGALMWDRTNGPASRGLAKLVVFIVLLMPTTFAIATGTFTRTETVARDRTAPRIVTPSAVRFARVVFGLALGAVATPWLLQPHAPLVAILCAVPVGAAVLGFASARTFRRLDAAALLALSAVLVPAALRFPQAKLAAGALDVFAVPTSNVVFAADPIRRAGDSLVLLGDSRGGSRMRGTGHDGIVGVRGHVSFVELVSGVMPALHAPKRERAFVFGGAGAIAAGAAARVFREVVVVEPNAAAPEMAQILHRHNLDFANRPNVTHVAGDVFVELAKRPERFDAIVSAAPFLRDVTASKVVTMEFMQLARARLVPGGVLAIALDDTLPIAGLAIVLRTLSDSFEECRFAAMGPGRYQVLCTDAWRSPSPGPLPEEIAAALDPLTAELGARRFLEALVLVPERFHGDWFPAPNTFDLPVLDYVMARDDNRTRAWDLDLALRFDIHAATLGGEPFDGPAVFDRCFALGMIGSGRAMPRCVTYLRSAMGGSLVARRDRANGLPLPAPFLAMSASAHGRNVPGLLSGPSLLAELVFAGKESTARDLVANRFSRGMLTAAEAAFAKRENLF